jgi:hypothetical protein
MQKFALLNASRMAALAAAGKVISFYYYIHAFFFAPASFVVDLPRHSRMLPAWLRLLRVRMLLRSLVRHIVLFACAPG